MTTNSWFGLRDFLRLTTAGLASGLVASPPFAIAAMRSKIKAVAFDSFPVFDPRRVFDLGEAFFPGQGTELGNEWHTRQFEYTWLGKTSGRNVDFWQITEDAPRYRSQS